MIRHCFSVSHSNKEVLESRAQSKFDVLQSWFKCNYLSINESKTKVLPLGDNPPHYELIADRVLWNTLEMFNDPNEALEQWYCLLNNVLGIHLPFKTRRVKIQHQLEWFSASISSAHKQCNNLHRQAVR